MITFDWYFIHGMTVGNIWYVAWRGHGYNENGLKIERQGKWFKFTRLRRG